MPEVKSKEQILESAYNHHKNVVNPDGNWADWESNVKDGTVDICYQAMSEWESQQSRAKDERIKELENGLRELIRCTGIFKENIITPDVTFEEYLSALSKAKQLLNKQ